MPDVQVIRADLLGANVYRDERGILVSNLMPERGQVNISINEPNVFRGLHLHRHQTDIWIPAHPLHIYYGRLTPPGKWITITSRVLQPGEALVIPPGHLHGFRTYDDPAVLTYMTSKTYNPQDELQVYAPEVMDISLDPLRVSARDLAREFTLDRARDLWYNGGSNDQS